MQHESLAAGRWQELTLCEQLGNVGSEVSRATSWTKKNNLMLAEKARERALELLDLTVADQKKVESQRKEILRVREALCDFWWGENEFKSTSEDFEKYFMTFAVMARS